MRGRTASVMPRAVEHFLSVCASSPSDRARSRAASGRFPRPVASLIQSTDSRAMPTHSSAHVAARRDFTQKRDPGKVGADVVVQVGRDRYACSPTRPAGALDTGRDLRRLTRRPLRPGRGATSAAIFGLSTRNDTRAGTSLTTPSELRRGHGIDIGLAPGWRRRSCVDYLSCCFGAVEPELIAKHFTGFCAGRGSRSQHVHPARGPRARRPAHPVRTLGVSRQL